MCGIVGYMDTRGLRPIETSLLRRMNDTLTHRGPDGDGIHIEPGIGLAHRRLSIIDLDGGKQPLFNEDLSVAVTFNGEIYNFQELMTELQRLGHVFRSRCDTEVIVHAWEEWGQRCVDRFNGMFAFAIWDRNQETLFIARDRLGIKPLHYALLSDGRFLFASELKALTAHPDVTRKIDEEAVEEFFTFGYVPDPKTIYSSVRKLEPGSCMALRRGSAIPSPHVYWDVPLYEEAADWSESRSSELLLAELAASVRRQLVSDVPLGAFLSGGIDSSAVVAMMRRNEVERVLTCSIGFNEKEYDESIYADLVACALMTDHRRETVEAGDYGLLDELVKAYDEPFADSSAIPTFRVCALARRHVTVALSGDGGDENFIGYRRYRYFALEERLRARLPLAVRRSAFGALGSMYPKLDWAPRFLRGKTTFQALARSSPHAYLHAVSVCTQEERQKLFSRDFRKRLGGYTSDHVFSRILSGKQFADPLRMAQYLDFKTYLPGDILTKVDRASMAHSLEVRVPILDHLFVELAAKIPTELKLKGSEGKYILKKSLEGLLPGKVLHREKMGFAVPLERWFRGSLSGRLSDTIAGEHLKGSGYFDADQLSQVIEAHRTGRRNYSAMLWSLVMFEGFLRSG